MALSTCCAKEDLFMQKANEPQTSASTDLAQKKCTPCKGGTQPHNSESVESNLRQLHGWALQDGALTQSFTFQNYYETTPFVNAAAWIAHQEDHHPDSVFGHKTCLIAFMTEAVKGITDNDFIAPLRSTDSSRNKGRNPRLCR